ncbi:MAG: hypothetical protein WBG57_12650 [Ornithinimicrobium sp.]
MKFSEVDLQARRLESVSVDGMRGASASGADDDPAGGFPGKRRTGKAGDSAVRQGAGEVVQVYRTLPARMLGWFMVAVIGTVGVVIVRTEYQLGGDVLVPSASLLLVITLVWIFLLRPSVELRSESVTSRNILRDTVVPFERLAEVSYQWSLELTDTAGRTWSSWAVPKQREFSMRRASDDFGETTRHPSRPGTTAQVVAGDVERERKRWLLAGGTAATTEGAHAFWAPQAVIPLLTSLALLLLALLVG